MTILQGCNSRNRAARLDQSNAISKITTMYARGDGMHRPDKDNSGRRPPIHERDSALAYTLTEQFDGPLRRCRILDVGCEEGGVLCWFRHPAAASENQCGIDLLPNRIMVDRELGPAFSSIGGDAEELALVGGRSNPLSERSEERYQYA